MDTKNEKLLLASKEQFEDLEMYLRHIAGFNSPYVSESYPLKKEGNGNKKISIVWFQDEQERKYWLGKGAVDLFAELPSWAVDLQKQREARRVQGVYGKAL